MLHSVVRVCELARVEAVAARDSSEPNSDDVNTTRDLPDPVGHLGERCAGNFHAHNEAVLTITERVAPTNTFVRIDAAPDALTFW